MLGVCVLCLGLACHQASSLGFALSHLVLAGLTETQMHPFQFTMSFCVGCWLIIGYSACICKACLRQAVFFNNTHVGCLCPLSASGLSLCIFVWFRLSRLASIGLAPGLRCIHLNLLSLFFFGCLAYAWLLFGRLTPKRHMLGVCVLRLGVACHHASSLGLASSDLA